MGGTIPIIVLAGSDLRPSRLPAEARGEHSLAAYKGVALRIGGRPLIAVVVERLLACGAFGPVFLAGPRRVYGGLDISAEIVDTDGGFGGNIRAGIEYVRTRHAGQPVAVTTCDIVAAVDDLRAAMDAWAAAAPCDLWSAVVRIPRGRRLPGVSAWKPTYRVVTRPGGPPEDVLPGHLCVADPEALRLRFIYDLFGRGYRLRNRSILWRAIAMPAGVLGAVLWQDVLHVAGGRLPTLTGDILVTGVRAGLRLRTGRASLDEIAAAARRVFVRRTHRQRWPDRRLVLAPIDGISLALDIDTEEEARAFGATIDEGSAGPR